jgi:hypothetical protein
MKNEKINVLIETKMIEWNFLYIESLKIITLLFHS